MTTKRKSALTLGTLAGTLVLSGAAFAVTPLANGYMGDGKSHAEGSCGMKSMDKNADGQLSKEEFAAAHDGKTDKFAAHDLDGNGAITQAEMDKAHAAMKKDKTKSTEGKCGEGKCGEGKCGGSKPKTDTKDAKASGAKAAEGKCGEGKCGAGKCGGSL